MKHFFRILSLVLALAIATGLLAGCSGSGQRAVPELHVYNCDEVDTGLDEFSENFGNVVLSKDRVYAIGYNYDETGGGRSTAMLLTAKLDGTDAKQLPLPLHETDPVNGSAGIEGFTVTPSGVLCLLECVYFWGTEENNWEDYGQTYYMHWLDAEGAVLGEAVLASGEDSYLSGYNMAASADGTVWIPSSSELLAVASDGSIRKVPVIKGEGYIDRISPLGGTELLVAWSGGEGDSWTTHASLLDTATGKLAEEELPVSESHLYDPIISDGAGKLYIYDEWGIYTFDAATGATELICSWLDSDLDYNHTVNALAARQDGTFVAVGQGEDWDKVIVSTLTYVDPDTLPEKTVLTLACTYGYDMRRAALTFNRQSDTVRITVKDYSEYNNEENEWNGAVTQMNTDIISGAVPDILLVTEQLPFHSYVSKGIFTDLYALMDAEDSPVKREDLLENILSAYEVDSQLFSIIPSFSVVTAVADSQLVGTEPGWSWDEFLALLDAHPEIEMAFPEMDRESILNLALLMGGKQFIDYASGVCNFDNPTFQKVLEYAATYPEEYSWDEEWVEPKVRYGNRTNLMYFTNLYDFDYALREMSYIFDGRVSYIGMPTMDGTGGSAISASNRLAISEACPDKAAAWEFVTSFLTYEYQTEDIWELPVRKDALNKKVEQAMDPETHGDYGISTEVIAKATVSVDAATPNEPATLEEPVEEETSDADATGEEAVPEDDIDVSDGVESDGMVILPSPAPSEEDYWNRPTSQAEVDLAMELITSVNTTYSLDNALLEIIFEEANAYFAGSKSAAETAAIIQNRASTYLAENQ